LLRKIKLWQLVISLLALSICVLSFPSWVHKSFLMFCIVHSFLETFLVKDLCDPGTTKAIYLLNALSIKSRMTFCKSNSNKSAITIKPAMYWHKNRQEYQWIRIEDTDVNLCIYSQAQNIWWRTDSLFNKCCWDNWISTWRRLKLDPCLCPCTKNQVKVDERP
jgi:hypothetical protein